MTDEGGKHQFQVVSRHEDVGLVVRCSCGCIHVSVGNTSLRLSTKQYWELTELLVESTRKMATLSPSERDIQEAVH